MVMPVRIDINPLSRLNIVRKSDLDKRIAMTLQYGYSSMDFVVLTAHVMNATKITITTRIRRR